MRMGGKEWGGGFEEVKLEKYTERWDCSLLVLNLMGSSGC